MNDIEQVLDNIRCNSSLLSRYHQKRFLVLKSRLKYYKISCIVLSALNSVGAVSIQPFMSQVYISLVNMIISLVVGIIGSIEMYYGITRQMETESNGSRDFYILSCDIFKFLSLREDNKAEGAVEFLNTSYNRYIKLVETSIVLKKKVEDKLAVVTIVFPTKVTNNIIPPQTPPSLQSVNLSSNLSIETLQETSSEENI